MYFFYYRLTYSYLWSIVVDDEGYELFYWELTDKKFPVDLNSFFISIYYCDFIFAIILKNNSLFRPFKIVLNLENIFDGYNPSSIVILSLSLSFSEVVNFPL